MMRRRGLSLVEVLIAIVLLGIVGAGITRMLQSQMRYFGKSTNERDARSVSRNALNLMRAEMRMIEPAGVIAAAADSITVHLPYAVGLHCSLSTGTFVPVDSLTWATAEYAGYAWRDTTANAAYTYEVSGTDPVPGLTTACTSVGLGVVPGGRELVLAPAIPVATVGAPLMLFQTVTYKFAASALVPGRTALWRRVTGGVAEEIAVPFDATSRFRFYIPAATTAQDAVPGTLSTMRGVEVVLRGESERASPGTAEPEVSESRVSILFRNAVQ